MLDFLYFKDLQGWVKGQFVKTFKRTQFNFHSSKFFEIFTQNCSCLGSTKLDP